MIAKVPLTSVCSRSHYHWFVVGTVCVGAFMAALDSSIVNIALPVMKDEFGTHMRVIEWVSLTYLLTLAAMMVPFSRLSDMYGRRWMYALGFSVFIVGSFLCGEAPSLSALLASRIVQAIGAAMLQSNSVSIITAASPARDRGKAIGIQAMAQGIGLSLGPVVGGSLLTFLGWRWIFYVNVPVGIIGTLLGILILPADESRQSKGRFDFWGSVALAPTLVALIYVLNAGAQAGWGSPVVIGCYAVLVVGIVSFVWIERSVSHPIVDLRLFRNSTFVVGNLSVALSFAVMYAVMFLSPFYLDDVHRMTSLAAGTLLTVIPAGMAICTPLSGYVADRFGTRLPALVGMLLAVVGVGAMALFTIWYASILFALGLFLTGCGMGVFTPANNSDVMGTLRADCLGVGGGILNLARTVGMGLGVALGGLSYQLFLSVHGVVSENQASVAQMIPSFREAFMVVGAIALAVLLLVGWGTRERH